MVECTSFVEWSRGDAVFTDNRYSRAHRWRFDGGLEVPASSSPHVVRLPFSDPAAIDPEEAFIASLSSCHMLTFLWLAGQRGFVVDTYRDEAVGILEDIAAGRQALTVVTLRPQVSWSGPRLPTAPDREALHHDAHELCFIANSVKTEVRCEPADPPA